MGVEVLGDQGARTSVRKNPESPIYPLSKNCPVKQRRKEASSDIKVLNPIPWTPDSKDTLLKTTLRSSPPCKTHVEPAESKSSSESKSFGKSTSKSCSSSSSNSSRIMSRGVGGQEQKQEQEQQQEPQHKQEQKQEQDPPKV